MARPSKLWKRLGAEHPVVAVDTYNQATYTDQNIAEWRVTRGAGNPFGLSTGSAQIAYVGAEWSSTLPQDTWTRVRFTDYGAQLIADLTGGGSPSPLINRFTGRRVSETFDDRGDPNLTRGRLTVTAHDYGALINLLDRASYALRGDTTVSAIHERAFLRIGAESVPFESYGPFPLPRLLAEDPDAKPISTGDVFGRYGNDVGVQTRVTRSGVPQSMSRNYRQTRAETLADAVSATGTTQALQRRQVLAPATWTKAASVGRTITAHVWDGGNIDVTGQLGDEGGFIAKGEELDLTHVQWNVPDASKVVMAHVYQAAQLSYVPDDVTIDLLQLLTSPRPDDRALARQLLLLEAGDPIVLAYDWPYPITGVFFADQIVEAMTPETFTLTLTLTHYSYVIGEYSPPVPGRTWHSAFPPHHQWQEPIASVTWATAPRTT